MKEWKKFESLDDEDDSFDIFINCAGLALEKDFLEKFPSLTDAKRKKDQLPSDYKEYLEDTLDMDTIYKVLEICAGMKLNDPNLLAAMAAQREDGTV
jgi:hypothetical protein